MRLALVSVLAAFAVAACSNTPSPTEPVATATDAAPAPPSDGRRPSTPTAQATRTATARDEAPADVEPFTDPDELARSLRAAELAIRDRDTPPSELAAWAWVQQQAYRDLVVHPDWRDTARAALPASLHGAFARNIVAGEHLRALTEPREELPPWRIVEPPPPEQLRRYYAAAQEEFGVPWTYLAAIHLVETRMGRIRGTSTAGAQGPMQFLPSTWEAYGEGDIEDPSDAIRAAARYLVAHGAPEDMDGALWAYNHSDHYVEAITSYAEVMDADERAWLGYYHWKVYYRLTTGDVVLEVGYERG